MVDIPLRLHASQPTFGDDDVHGGGAVPGHHVFDPSTGFVHPYVVASGDEPAEPCAVDMGVFLTRLETAASSAGQAAVTKFLQLSATPFPGSHSIVRVYSARIAAIVAATIPDASLFVTADPPASTVPSTSSSAEKGLSTMPSWIVSFSQHAWSPVASGFVASVEKAVREWMYQGIVPPPPITAAAAGGGVGVAAVAPTATMRMLVKHLQPLMDSCLSDVFLGAALNRLADLCTAAGGLSSDGFLAWMIEEFRRYGAPGTNIDGVSLGALVVLHMFALCGWTWEAATVSVVRLPRPAWRVADAVLGDPLTPTLLSARDCKRRIALSGPFGASSGSDQSIAGTTKHCLRHVFQHCCFRDRGGLLEGRSSSIDVVSFDCIVSLIEAARWPHPALPPEATLLAIWRRLLEEAAAARDTPPALMTWSGYATEGGFLRFMALLFDALSPMVAQRRAFVDEYVWCFLSRLGFDGRLHHRATSGHLQLLHGAGGGRHTSECRCAPFALQWAAITAAEDDAFREHVSTVIDRQADEKRLLVRQRSIRLLTATHQTHPGIAGTGAPIHPSRQRRGGQRHVVSTVTDVGVYRAPPIHSAAQTVVAPSTATSPHRGGRQRSPPGEHSGGLRRHMRGTCSLYGLNGVVRVLNPQQRKALRLPPLGNASDSLSSVSSPNKKSTGGDPQEAAVVFPEWEEEDEMAGDSGRHATWSQ